MRRSRWLLVCTVAAAALIASCATPRGGGGGGTLNVAPSAVATATPTSGPAPLAVDFDGSASTDSDGTIASYSWNFGDGSPVEAGATVSHVYTEAGTYAASLVVTDNRGGTDVELVEIVAGSENQSPTALATASMSTTAVWVAPSSSVTVRVATAGPGST